MRVHHGQLYRYELQTNQHKVIATLEAVGWPTAQAGVSTVVCVLPLILLQVSIGVFTSMFRAAEQLCGVGC